LVNSSTKRQTLKIDSLNAVEGKIENATFDTDAEKLAGLMILFELNDAPDFAFNLRPSYFLEYINLRE
jgi:hypothetical protein